MEIANAITGKQFETQKELDNTLIKLDGTSNKLRLGANAILGVSIAFARATALKEGIPLYRYLNDKNKYLMPVPCMNVINGGKHADNNVDFQEFMIAPHNVPSFKESIRMGVEVFHTLKEILKSKGYSTGVGMKGALHQTCLPDRQA